ncbi:hypothetical protein [Lactococcus formosensis]|uniref:hypothetical protein n=1 Tax=Lactococcus formosensis TaxID=1281486 RepID=UPI00254C532E|nr:hypothetical protein [Lactococcus formosensis]
MSLQRSKKKKMDGPLVLAAIIMVVVLAVNSMSSFLYWTNTWVDTNATWVLAKAMLFDSQVLYKDIYDQRGIILYLVYGIGSLISALFATKTSFIGLFILECLFGILNLIFARKIIDLVRIKYKYLAMIAAVFIFSNIARGGAPEEFMNPLVTILLYLILKISYHDYKLTKIDYYLQGLFLALAFWTKFSFMGFWLGFFLYIGLDLLIKKDFIKLIRAATFSLIGFATVTLPVLFYFLINGALGDLYFGYWKLNTQYYRPSASLMNNLINIPGNFFIDWTANPFRTLFFILLIFGCVYFLKKNTQLLFIVICVGVAGVYFSGTAYEYYSFIFHPFVYLGILAVLKVLENKFKTLNINQLVIIGGLLILLSFRGNSVTQLSIQENKDIISLIQSHSPNQTPSILQYSGLDTRFYNLLGVNPNIKYFLQTNINKEQFPEMPLERLRYMDESKIDFVLYNKSLPTSFESLPNSDLTITTSQEYFNRHGNKLTIKVPKVLKDNYHLIGNEGDYLVYKKNV